MRRNLSTLLTAIIPGEVVTKAPDTAEQLAARRPTTEPLFIQSEKKSRQKKHKEPTESSCSQV